MDKTHVQDALHEAKELLRREAYGEAEALLSRLIHDIESQLGNDAAELIGPLYRHAESVSKQHPWNTLVPEQWASLERALRLAVLHHGEDSARAMRIRGTLAASLSSAGEHALAAEHMAIVVRVMERLWGENILLAHELAGLAGMLFELKRFEEALSTYERAFGMTRGHGEDLSEAQLELNQGRCLIELGRHADAVPRLERAFGCFLQKYGERNKVVQWVRSLLEQAREGDRGE